MCSILYQVHAEHIVTEPSNKQSPLITCHTGEQYCNQEWQDKVVMKTCKEEVTRLDRGDVSHARTTFPSQLLTSTHTFTYISHIYKSHCPARYKDSCISGHVLINATISLFIILQGIILLNLNRKYTDFF